MDDRILVYRGADQPDMSVINPESDVWQHVKVGQENCLLSKLLNDYPDTTGLFGNKLANKIFCY